MPGARGATPEDKRAEAVRIQKDIDAQAERIAALDRELRRAGDEQRDADAAVVAAASRFEAKKRELETARSRAAAQAVDAYIHGGRVGLVDQLAGSDGRDLAIRRHLVETAAREDAAAIDALSQARDDLELSYEHLRDAQESARSARADLLVDREAVADGEADQRANLRRVRGELAELVREQQAREIAAAARRAAAQAPRPAPPTPVGPAPPASVVLPPTSPTTTRPDVSEPSPHVPPGGIWACIRQKESGNNYRSPGGGAYQFLLATWESLGGTGDPADAPPAVQDAMAIKLQQRSGWGQWTTAAACGAF